MPAAKPSVGGVPKLNLKQVSNLTEYRDWQTYAMKLENSVKFLRDQVEMMERNIESLNSKVQAEQSAKEQCVQINEKLLQALNTQKARVQAVKERYRAKAAKNKCNCCDNNSNSSMDFGDSFMINPNKADPTKSAYVDDPVQQMQQMQKFNVQIIKDCQKTR